MKALCEATFKRLSGEGAYQRGLAYYNEGRVQDLVINGTQITAVVRGTEHYTVVLHHTAKQFEGECNCPASDNFDFCKHCVAASLSYYYQTQTNQELAEGTDDELILNYLNTLTKPQLVNDLHHLIQRDAKELDHWQLKAEIASGGLRAPEIRKRVTKALPYKASGLWRYRDVSDYFANAEQALSVLEGPLNALLPEVGFKLAVYGLQRLEKTLRNIDDSGGYRFAVEQRLTEWFSRCLSSPDWAERGKSAEIAKVILDQEYSYDVLNLPEKLDSELSTQGTSVVYKAVDAAWAALAPGAELYSDEHYYYQRLESLLVRHAQQTNNVERELEVLGKGAIRVEQCLNLVERCIELHRLDDAQQWLHFAEQIKQHQNKELYSIESAQIALWIAQGHSDLALAALWARFEEQESLSSLNEVLACCGAAEKSRWLTRGIQHLSGQLIPYDDHQKDRQRAETLASIYIRNTMTTDAIKLHRKVPLKPHTLVQLVSKARTLNTGLLALIEYATNGLLVLSYHNVYEETVAFLSKQYQRCPSALHANFNEMVLRIYNKPENKRKVNFIKLLKAAFSHLFND